MVPAGPPSPSSLPSPAEADSDRTVPLDTYPSHVRDTTLAYLGATDDQPPLADLLAVLPVPADLNAHDDCADWHYTTPRPAMVRALLYNHAHGWRNDSRLRRALRHNPHLLGRLGFDTVPDQSTLWRVQHKQFSPTLIRTLRAAAGELAAVAREHGYDLPGPAAEQSADASGRDGRLRGPGPTIENAQAVTEQARRLVYPHLELDRADNWAIPESAFWDLQRYMGLREDCSAHSGAREFALEADHEVTPLGHNHREQVRDQAWWEYRQHLQDGIASVVDELKRAGQFQRPVTVAIDTTEGPPLHGEYDADNPEIPGTKEPGDDYAYQWATIQVVNHDCPLVLDAVPKQVGDSMDDLVDELLTTARQHVDVELVLMDRGFDSMDVKAACERHRVSFANPKRKHTSEKEHCRRLAAREATVDVVHRDPVDGPSHCQVYVPKRDGPQVSLDEIRDILVPPQLDEEDSGGEPDEAAGQSASEKLWTDLDDTLDTAVETPGEEGDESADDPIGEFLAALAGDGETQRREDAPEDDADYYVVFETNHPSIDPDDDEADMRHAVARLMRRYQQRWITENAYKRFKPFMAATQSRDLGLRYFYFGFAALVLYNLWKVVCLLVAERMGVEQSEVDLPASTALLLAGKATGVG